MKEIVIENQDIMESKVLSDLSHDDLVLRCKKLMQIVCKTKDEKDDAIAKLDKMKESSSQSQSDLDLKRASDAAQNETLRILEKERAIWSERLNEEKKSHEEMIAKLKSDLKKITTEKNERIGAQQSESLKEAEEELNRKQIRIEELKMELQNVVSEKNKAIEELKIELSHEREIALKFKKSLDDLKEENQTNVERKTNCLELEVSKLQEERSICEEEKSRLNSLLKISENKLLQSASEVIEKDQENKKLNGALVDLKDKFECLEEAKVSLHEETIRLNDLVVSSEKKLCEDRLEEIENLNTELSEKKAALDLLLSEFSDFKLNSESRLESFEGDKLIVETQLSETYEERIKILLHEKEEEISKLTVLMEQAQRESESLKVECQNLFISNSAKEQELRNTFEALLLEKESESCGLKSELKKAHGHICDLKNDSEQWVAEKLRLIEDHESTIQKAIESKDSIIQQLKAELKATQVQLGEWNVKLQDLEKESSKTLLREKAHKKEMESVISDIIAEREELKSELNCVRSDFETVKTDLETRIEQLSATLEQISTMFQGETLKPHELITTVNNYVLERKSELDKIKLYEEEISALKENVYLLKGRLDSHSLVTVFNNNPESKLADDEEVNHGDKGMKHNDESRSEIESNCTTSRTEERCRLEDCESYFEDRYSKLKVIAMKLKKKVSSCEAKMKEDKEKILCANNNLSSMQVQFDKLQEEISEKNARIKTLEKDLEDSIGDIVRTKEHMEILKEEINSLKSKNSVLSVDAAQYITKIEMERIENEALSKENSDVKSQLKSLEETRDKEIRELTSTVEFFKTKEDLYHRAEALDIELENSEEKNRELNLKKEEDEKTIHEISNELRHREEIKKNLELQVENLELSLAKESERANDLKTKLAENRQRATALDNTIIENTKELAYLREQVSNLTQEREDLASKFEVECGSTAQENLSLNSKNESLKKKLYVLEEDSQRKAILLEETRAELVDLEKEFSSYKLRAQSVLRSAKSSQKEPCSTLTSESRAKELIHLERTVQNLNEKMEALRNNYTASELEKKHLQEDHDRLMQRHSLLLQEMAAKEVTARNKQEELIRLANRAQSSCEEKSIQQKIKLEEVVQSYEVKIQELTSKQSDAIAKLQKQIDHLDNQNIVLQLAAQQRQSPSVIQLDNSCTPAFEREAAEGSEEHSSSNIARMSPSEYADESTSSYGGATPVPLDQLLESSLPEFACKVTDSRIKAVDPETKTLEKKILHLSNLLSESESENHRLLELMEVLKEEIRSYRRSEDRIKHIEHLEYIKNVILNFITMSDYQGKHQLLPVISKILELSPEEVNKVKSSIQTQTEIDEGVSNDAPSVSWSSYLSLWSGE